MAEPQEPSSVLIKKEEPGEIVYINQASNSHWENLNFDQALYKTPYKVSLFNPQNGEDKKRLWSQTKSVFGYGLGVMGVLALMPEDVTGWDSDRDESLIQKWGENVKEIAVWDRDDWYLNYIGHPYFGGVYYQSARKSGYRQWDAFLYSFMMSTFYWEYGVEAFAEIPAIQDLVITPVMGWVVGEWAFNSEQQIRQRGGTVWGSRGWGNAALFFLDPVDSFGSWVNNKVGRRLIRAGTGYITYGDIPIGDMRNAPTDKQVTLNVQYTISQGNEPLHYKRYRAISDDPVDTGIVGFSLGVGHIRLDDDWGFDSGTFPEWTLGLYFSPRFSTRLRYGRAKLDDELTGHTITYENYSLDSQFYFNSEGKTRPFITAGIGEEIFEKDRDRKNILWNLGLGVHHKISDNWALQVDFKNFYSPSKKTYEKSVNASLLFRFGRGEDGGL